jgi:hypothetical protein
MAYHRPKGKGIAILHILVRRIIKLRHVGDQLVWLEKEWDREELCYRRDSIARVDVTEACFPCGQLLEAFYMRPNQKYGSHYEGC